MLQPRSERTRRFDLFENPDAFLEFAEMPATEDGIKTFADRYGPLFPDSPDPFVSPTTNWAPMNFPGRRIDAWPEWSKAMHRTVELWVMSRKTGDFSKLIRALHRLRLGLPLHRRTDDFDSGASIEVLLKEDPLGGSPKLCIRPENLVDALWAQLILKIDGKVNLHACIQCRKWFTLEAGHGRSDKVYCSDACRMRAYRKRKGRG
jgi:hypothetical protein